MSSHSTGLSEAERSRAATAAAAQVRAALEGSAGRRVGDSEREK